MRKLESTQEEKAIPMKISQSYLNPIKILSSLFLLLGLALTFLVTLGLYSERHSFSLKPSFQSVAATAPLDHIHGQRQIQDSKTGSQPTSTTAMPDQVAPWLLAHIMTDRENEELMTTAARAAEKMEKSPEKKKIAFIFLVKGRLPFAALWEEFLKGHKGLYSIYVHADPSFNSSSELNAGVFRGRRIPSQEVQWGKFTMIEAEFRLLSTALLDPSNQRFVLLSESCIPLFNFSMVYSYLLNSTQTFVQLYDLEGRGGRDRYKRRLVPAITIEQWRKGSQWFEMDRALATRVIQDRAYYTVFKNFCWRYSCYADEHYLPTWVNIHYGSKNANRSVTYVDWTRGGRHPISYGRQYITVGFLDFLRHGKTCEYNGKETNVCFMFARKFPPDALDGLLLLAPKVMHF